MCMFNSIVSDEETKANKETKNYQVSMYKLYQNNMFLSIATFLSRYYL